MSGERVINFEVCANNEVIAELPDGHELSIEEFEPNKFRISAKPSQRSRQFLDAAQFADVMEDGTLFAGISPSTARPFFLPSIDHPTYMARNDAELYLQKLALHGHNDWRLISPAELEKVFSSKPNTNPASIVLDRRRKNFWVRASNGSMVTARQNGQVIHRVPAASRPFTIAVRG